MIEEIDLSEYIDTGRSTAKVRAGYDFSRRPYRRQGWPVFRDPMACDCAVCQPMRYPPPLIALPAPVVAVSDQLELFAVKL